MSKQKNQKREDANRSESVYETYRKVRGSWFGVKPITKVIPNKKKNSKESAAEATRSYE